MKVVPELLCSDIGETRRFFAEVLEFEVKFEREEDLFVYFSREGVDLMFEQLSGPGRRWLTGVMELPFGRGMNLMWEVSDTEGFYQRVKERAPSNIYMELETKSYRCDDSVVTQKQFIVQDPNGYLFRFCDYLE